MRLSGTCGRGDLWASEVAGRASRERPATVACCVACLLPTCHATTVACCLLPTCHSRSTPLRQQNRFIIAFELRVSILHQSLHACRPRRRPRRRRRRRRRLAALPRACERVAASAWSAGTTATETATATATHNPAWLAGTSRSLSQCARGSCRRPPRQSQGRVAPVARHRRVTAPHRRRMERDASNEATSD